MVYNTCEEGDRPSIVGISCDGDMSSLEVEGPYGGGDCGFGKAKTSWGAAMDLDLPGVGSTLFFPVASTVAEVFLVWEGLASCEVLEMAVPMLCCLEGTIKSPCLWVFFSCLWDLERATSPWAKLVEGMFRFLGLGGRLRGVLPNLPTRPHQGLVGVVLLAPEFDTGACGTLLTESG